jgi:glycosyltransferase involved in cell wall biosynthesis
MSWCVVIPTYNNERTLYQVIQQVLSVTADVIVVNDGSTDGTAAILDNIPQIKPVTYKSNKGKGYALKQGFALATRLGYSHAITLDSDGQHDAHDIQPLVHEMHKNPDALIVGCRTLPQDKLRKGSGFANRFSNLWFKWIAGEELPDTQSGFRVYPLHRLQDMQFFTRKYEFELEVLIRAAWKGIPLAHIPISVFYPEKTERVSHYRPFRDFMRISLLNAVMFFIAFFYIKPLSFLGYLKRDKLKEFVMRNMLQSRDSTGKITLSVMLGVFMGIVPIWGYQLVTAIALAYLFRLNRLIVIMAANISIPPMIPLILYLSYLTGSLVLGNGFHLAFGHPITFAFVKQNLLQYILGSFIFGGMLSLAMGLMVYVLLTLIRKNRIIS